MMNDTRDQSGPQIHSARWEDVAREDGLVKALDLARQIEELLEDTRSLVGRVDARDAGAHSTRMARAMAAGLVDELTVLVRPARQSGTA